MRQHLPWDRPNGANHCMHEHPTPLPTGSQKMAHLIAVIALVFVSSACPAVDAAGLRQHGWTVTERAGDIIGLAGTGPLLAAEELRAIAGVTTLTSLSLGGAGGALSDETLPLLLTLTGLQELALNGATLSDAGLGQLSSFHALRSLQLFHLSRGRADFTGAGLAQLAQLPALERLTLAGATVGDAAIAALITLPHLRELRFWHNTETSHGLCQLAALTSLRSLTLGQRLAGRERSDPSLDDAVLTAIAHLPHLEELSLQEARLSIDALLQLAQIGTLKKLTAAQIVTTATDIDRLRLALPGVTIAWTALTPEQAQALITKDKL